MPDPVAELAHDHAALNKQVIDLGVRLTELAAHNQTCGELADELAAMREQLFRHFAQEEEGLFPFVIDSFPDHAAQVEAMATAHDTICGALARTTAMAADDAEAAMVLPVFQRFETAYASHALSEAALLGAVDARLTPAQRARLADLVHDL